MEMHVFPQSFSVVPAKVQTQQGEADVMRLQFTDIGGTSVFVTFGMQPVSNRSAAELKDAPDGRAVSRGEAVVHPHAPGVSGEQAPGMGARTPEPLPLQVECPACGAAPGRLCIRMSHKTNAHFARWRVVWAQAKATR